MMRKIQINFSKLTSLIILIPCLLLTLVSEGMAHGEPASELEQFLLAVRQRFASPGYSLQSIEYHKNKGLLLAVGYIDEKSHTFDRNFTLLECSSQGVNNTKLQSPFFSRPKIINGVLWYAEQTGYAYHFRLPSGEWKLFGPFERSQTVSIEKIFDPLWVAHPFTLETLEHVISSREILQPITLFSNGEHTVGKAVTGFWDYALHPILGHLPVWPDRSEKINEIVTPIAYTNSFKSFLVIAAKDIQFLGWIHPDGNPIKAGHPVLLKNQPDEYFVNIEYKSKPHILFYSESNYLHLNGLHFFDLDSLQHSAFLHYTDATGFYAEGDTGYFFTPKGIEKISFETGERFMLGEEQKSESTPPQQSSPSVVSP